MREAFVHESLVRLVPGGDPRALGAAVTVGLCGAWEHDPPCPLAPHNSRIERTAHDGVRLRVLFVAEPDDEAQVRRRIEDALALGELVGPDGRSSQWQVLSSSAGPVLDGDQPLVGNLLRV